MQPATLSALIALVREHTGIAMSDRKSVLLERRLRPRMLALDIASYQGYVQRVRDDDAEVAHFIDLVTTNDTLFFRTQHVWDYVEREFLPRWWRAHPDRTLTVWSAAASSGEELYSLAMLCDQFAAHAPGFRYRILGTDISRQILAQAGAGDYAGRSVERLLASHPDWVAKYFTARGDSLRVVDALKRHVTLAQHNLLKPLRPPSPFTHQQFDLVFLRNVLFYFDQEHQQAVLQQVRHSMAPQARLILGESESITGLDTAWQFERPLIYTLDKPPS
ncbi:chemotaxis protein methyltransferase CheR [Duganella sp. CF517]|uniref:CheR family methyltransferase n=1 Tax=Duganella sp. CF517 TaxID=1881038 RepID=UPI0008D01087|nr:protein-glutamate O-methyltransferase CheR [Duganella sp. CF517]SEN86004.1 chemotaxis protein methyltransferase CheR [Duganella sp. CF517]